ncbi:MAG: hypothetical protein AUI21_09200 [Nitrospirae bacterium 13_1_40CM_2_62_10]|nr:MAG: hypothetical protein AUI21_09200 [Nitrospirae bacterium 13_1_40CM_2_62_10]
MAIPVRVGISQCLLGDNVRYDGGHKLDSVLIETLCRHVEWVPVCPEVEVGLGTPREPMHLVGDPQAPRLVTLNTGVDHTDAMHRFAQKRVRELEALNLSGFVFKSASPSCGIREVSLFTTQSVETRDSIGLFARAFMEHFPEMPVEDESRLHDPQAVKDFLERVLAYRRSRN